MNMRVALVFVACGELAACATRPAPGAEPCLLRVGDADIGYRIRPIGQTFTVNPGSTIIWAWYYGSRQGLDGAYIQSDPVDMHATLAPAARYELKAQIGAYEEARTRAGMGTVKFSLVDLAGSARRCSSRACCCLMPPSAPSA